MTRNIVYISGTRADFGLIRLTLQAICDAPGLSLSVIAAGMHLSPAHGNTIDEIEASGLPILARVPIAVSPATGGTMARGIATMTAAFTDLLESERPDIVLLLGDRGEMLAGAIAALHLNIAVAHIHGGERSGTIDEPIRHAISKLSHIHLVATKSSRERLVRMGEDPAHIYQVGAPGLDGLCNGPLASRADICARFGLSPDHPIALMLYHPVVQEAQQAGAQADALLRLLSSRSVGTIVLMPNADAGSDELRSRLEAHRAKPGVALITHLERADFLDVMAVADVMIGNSSAGIIEAASFGTPVVNIGTRQNLRERNANVLDCSPTAEAISRALDASLKHGRFAKANVYGDGRASARIVSILRETPINADLVMKINGY